MTRQRLLWLALAALACGRETPDVQPTQAEPGTAADTAPASDPSGESAPELDYLRAPAERLVAFLRGEAVVPPALLADSVVLHVAPEGGGAARTVAAGQLEDRTSWRVGAHDLAPPAGMSELALHPGRHANCRPLPLASLYSDLARSPHIGATLSSPGAASCLQTWNLTFVFNDDREAPRLTAVVYDQWEW